MTIPPFVAFITAWIGLLSGIWFLFDKADSVIKTETKKEISNWLLNKEEVINMAKFSIIFSKVFDSIFGEKHFSFKCFGKSSLISTSVVILLLLWGLFFVTGIDNVVIDEERFLELIFLTFFINNIGDYISLLETRYLLKFMENKSIITQLLIIFFDLFLTTCICYVGINFTLITLSLIFLSHIEFWSPNQFILDLYYRFLMEEKDSTLFIWIGTTYLTSIWSILFFFSSLIIKGFNFANKILRYFGNFFDLIKNPIRSLGFVTMILVSIVILITSFLY